MRDDFQDYSPDPSSQKSVSDWLMHVISGKKPVEAQPDNTTPGKGGWEETARDAGAVAVEEMPSESEPTNVAAEKKNEMTMAAEFTAEDLCGPAVFKAPASAAVKEEITADDLCFVPKSEQMKPHRNGTSATVEPAEKLRMDAPVVALPEEKRVAESVEIPEPKQSRAAEVMAAAEPKQEEAAQSQHERVQKVAEAKEPERLAPVESGEKTPEQHASDFLMRDRVRYSGAPPETARFSRKREPAAVDREVTVADILRDRVLRQMQPAVEPLQAKTQPVAPEPDAIADVLLKKDEQPIEEAKAAETVVEMVLEGKTSLPDLSVPMGAPEPSVFGTASAEEPRTVGENLPPAEPQVIEVAAAAGAVEELSGGTKAEAKTDSDAADGAKSVFAQEGIWGGGAAQVSGEAREDAAYQEPAFSEEDPMYQASKRGYLKPEELQELEHAMEEEKPENLSSALKTLVKLGSVLPWISRTAPGAEGGPGSEMETGLSHEGRHEIANLRMIQYEIRSTVHDHSLQLKRMEEQVIRVRESLESGSREGMDLAESVKSTVKLLRLVGIGLGLLMVVLIVMVGLLMGHK